MRRIVVFTQNAGKQRSSSRAGFTLIELLVVISIIATLMSLILPAIQNAREAGRRTQCLNNIRNVTVACMNFASSNPAGHLPSLSSYPQQPGSGGILPKFYEGKNWVFDILPFMDQQGTYDRWDKELPWNSTATNKNGAVNLNLASDLYIQALACPNDESAFATPGGLSYVANAGFGSSITGANGGVAQTRGHNFFDADLDWNSNGTASEPEDDEITFRTGVFWPIFENGNFKAICKNHCFSPGKIYDGSANTLMLSENINAGQTNWANPSINSCGFMFPVNGGASAATDTGKASMLMLQNASLGQQTGTTPFINQKKSGPEGAPFPNSNHPGVAVFSLCDGSARTISESVDKHVYTQLITPDGSRLRTLSTGVFRAEDPVSSSDF